MNPISPTIYIAFVIASRHFWTWTVYSSLCFTLDFFLMLFSHSKSILWAVDTSVRESFLCMCWRINSKVVLRDTVKHTLKQIKARGLAGISYHQSGKQYMYANCENWARLGIRSLRKYHIRKNKALHRNESISNHLMVTGDKIVSWKLFIFHFNGTYQA